MPAPKLSSYVGALGHFIIIQQIPVHEVFEDHIIFTALVLTDTLIYMTLGPDDASVKT